MRQLSYFKQKLLQDEKKYHQNFTAQKSSFQDSQKLVNEQFDYLRKMLEIKQNEVQSKLTNYWSDCQSIYQGTCLKIGQQIKKFDHYGELLQKFSENLTNLQYFDKKIKRFNVNFQICNLKSANFDQALNGIMSVSVVDKPWENNNPQAVQTDNNDSTARQISK